MVDNKTARGFVSLLPLRVSMNHLFGREKYGDLAKTLSEEGPGNSMSAIAYWSPNQQFASSTANMARRSLLPALYPLPSSIAGAEAFNVPGSVKVTIELAK